MTMPAERKLKKVVIDLMRNPMFADMSGILMLGAKTIIDDFPTAATDGYNEVYGRQFVDELDLKGLAFVVLHEGMHKLLRQLTVWHGLFKQDPQLANCAADYVVNGMLLARDPQGTAITLPTIGGKKVGLHDLRFANMTTKQVFDILKQEQQQNGGNGAPGQGQPGQPGQGGAPGGFDDHDWGSANGTSPEERAVQERELDQAIRQGQIAAQKVLGSGAGNMNRELEDLLHPKVDWRELLREFVTSTCAGRDFSSWRRPNRRFLSQGYIMPSMVSERVRHIVVGVDTSGSIGGPEITRFLSEIKAIAELVRPEQVDLIYWDSRVAGHEVYNEATLDSLVESTKPRGGGGTHVGALFDHVKKELPNPPEVCIVFTDGYTPWPDVPPTYPTLFAVCGSRVEAPFGQTIHVED